MLFYLDEIRPLHALRAYDFTDYIKSFCMRDRGGLRNEGSPILLKIYIEEQPEMANISDRVYSMPILYIKNFLTAL